MKYFTSIELLRNSSAETRRVDAVERNLKELNSNWQPNWMFPISAIGLSNVADDIHWVYDNQSVCVRSQPKAVFLNGVNIGTMTQLHDALVKDKVQEPADVDNRNKSDWCNQNLASIDATLTRLAGKWALWTQGLTFEQAAPADAPVANDAQQPSGQESGQSLDFVKDSILAMTDAEKAEIRAFVLEHCPETKAA